jgi:hypothetical protein
MLSNCIDSIYRNAKYPETIETLVLYDSDDEETLDTLLRKIKEYGDCIKYECRQLPPEGRVKKALNLNRDYNNYGALKSTGKYVWGIGNDTKINTKHWDVVVKTAIEDFVYPNNDRLCFAFVDDDCPSHMTAHYRKVCSFPILTRESVEVMQGIFPNEITGHTADVFLIDIYRKLSQNRVLDLFDKVYIEHICHYNKKTTQDKVNIDMFLYMDHVSYLSEEQINEYVDKFNKIIENRQ